MASFSNLLTDRGPDPIIGPAGETPVPHDELAEYRESYDGKFRESTRLLLCDWNKRHDLLRAMLPTARTNGATGATVAIAPYGSETSPSLPYRSYGSATRLALARLNGHRHPWLRYSDYAGPRAVTGQVIEGVGYPGQLAASPAAIQFFQNTPGLLAPVQGKAKVAVVYRDLPYYVGPDDGAFPTNTLTNADANCEVTRYVVRKPKPAVQSLPTYEMTWKMLEPRLHPATGAIIGSTDRGTLPEKVRKLLFENHLIYSWYMVPQLPPAADILMGLVNCGPFATPKDDWDSPDFPCYGSAKVGRLLYMHPEFSEPYFTYHGDKVWDIHYHFLHRAPGHNWIFKPLIGWVFLFRRTIQNDFVSTPLTPPTYLEPAPVGAPPSSVSDTIYSYTDFNNLFRLSTLPT